MQGSIYSSPFPALNPRVRYKTALERAGFDVYHNHSHPEREPGRPYLEGRHVSEGGRRSLGAHSEPRLVHTQQNNGNRAVSAREPQQIPYGWKTPDLPREHFSSPQLHIPARVESPGRESALQSRRAEADKRSTGNNQLDQDPGFSTNRSVRSRASGHSATRNQRDSSVFDFENKRTSVDPVEKSFLQLTQTSNESDRSSQERGFTPYEVDSTTSAGVSDDEFKDAQSHHASADEVPGMAKWRSIMRYSEATHEQLHPEVPGDYDLNATPDSKRVSESSISFTPVAELHVRLSTQDPPSSLPVINITNEDRKDTLLSHSEGNDIDSPDERSLKSLNLEPELPLASLVQQHQQQRQPRSTEKEAEPMKEEIEDELEEAGEDFDPSSTLKSSLQVEKLLAQLDDTSTNRNLAVGGPRPDLASRFKKSSAYLSGFVPAPTSVDIDDALQPNPILQQEVLRAESSVDNAPDFKSQTIHVRTEPAVSRDRIDSPPDSDGSPMFFKFRKDLGPHRHTSSDGEAVDGYADALRPSERLKLSLQTPISLKQLDGIATKREVTGPGSKDKPDTNASESENEVSKQSPKFPPGQGPCRACGLEVTSKSIFSKKENELSGQWHRPCFRCIKCDVKFSKHVPCYILDDEPYCQLHYHTANNSICQICYNFIEGECLENDRDERFHVECLRCFKCREFIHEDYYLFNNELPLCHNHDIEALKLEVLSEFGDTTTISKRRTRIVNFSGEN
ncbi:LAFA_0E19130g1_1 [Lachancea sp. 'fantastica']|nr:LAFA_0E19130g1_1 [Lachancea sp. 'fantastica']